MTHVHAGTPHMTAATAVIGWVATFYLGNYGNNVGCRSVRMPGGNCLLITAVVNGFVLAVDIRSQK